MKRLFLILICSCGPQPPTTSTTDTSSSAIMETNGNSTSSSGITPTEVLSSTGSTTMICEPGAPICPDMGNMESSGTTMSVPKPDFEPCHESIECEGGICITNDTGASFCTSSCNKKIPICTDDFCFADNFCVIPCETTNDCPMNMFCEPFFEKKVCFAI